MIRVAIVDDDKNSCFTTTAFLREFEDITVVGDFQNSRDFFAFLSKNLIQAVFLDIELDRENGFEIAATLKKDYPQLLIVFLTGHSTYAVDSFDFQPLYFLTKPIHTKKLNFAIDLLRKKTTQVKEQSSAKLMFKCVPGYEIYDVKDICYIERNNRKNYLVTEKGKRQISYYTLTELMDMLEPHGFFMCYQSFIISIKRIERLWGEAPQIYYVKLRGCEEKIPVSRNCYESLRQVLKEEWNE